MKTLRLIVGIISCVLTIVILLQSCTVGLGNVLMESEETSGASGMFLAVLMLIAGLLGIAGRKSNGAIVTGAVFYMIAGLVGTTGAGSFTDLKLWGSLCYLFAALYIVSVLISRLQKVQGTQGLPGSPEPEAPAGEATKPITITSRKEK